jgi:hypothetical protein
MTHIYLQGWGISTKLFDFSIALGLKEASFTKRAPKGYTLVVGQRQSGKEGHA